MKRAPAPAPPRNNMKTLLFRLIEIRSSPTGQKKEDEFFKKNLEGKKGREKRKGDRTCSKLCTFQDHLFTPNPVPSEMISTGWLIKDRWSP